MFAIKQTVPGSEGTKNYVVICKSTLALVAVRLVHGSIYRVRVEPSSATAGNAMAAVLSRADGWKQPGDQDQDRFSTLVEGGTSLRRAVTQAVEASQGTDDDIEGALAAIVMVGSTDRAELISRLQSLKGHGISMGGVNAASQWTTTTLVAKLVGLIDEKVSLVERVQQKKLPGANLAITWSVATLRRKALQTA